MSDELPEPDDVPTMGAPKAAGLEMIDEQGRRVRRETDGSVTVLGKGHGDFTVVAGDDEENTQ